jgi:hypothetical protein
MQVKMGPIHKAVEFMALKTKASQVTLRYHYSIILF